MLMHLSNCHFGQLIRAVGLSVYLYDKGEQHSSFSYDKLNYDNDYTVYSH